MPWAMVLVSATQGTDGGFTAVPFRVNASAASPTGLSTANDVAEALLALATSSGATLPFTDQLMAAAGLAEAGSVWARPRTQYP